MGIETFFGFDSAWTDNPKAPGAICALQLHGDGAIAFHAPRLVGFDGARSFIEALADPEGFSLLAIDQPTIVPNATSMRPVERAAASFVSWLGGGVQPSNTGRKRMFDADAPIWPFLRRLSASEDPIAARSAGSGLHIIEVFPAIALPSLDERFFGLRRAPRYNPARSRTFRSEDWRAVAEAVAAQFERFDLPELAAASRGAGAVERPAKADQDKLDSLICLIVALHWRKRPPCETLMLGSLDSGYMAMPASGLARERLIDRAEAFGVPWA